MFKRVGGKQTTAMGFEKPIDKLPYVLLSRYGKAKHEYCFFDYEVPGRLKLSHKSLNCFVVNFQDSSKIKLFYAVLQEPSET